MKKLILLSCLLILFLTGISQQESTATGPAQNNYLSKAKKQNTAAWVLLGGGFTFTTAGIIGSSTRIINEIGASFSGEHDKGYRTSSVFVVVGLTTMLSSIPFFVVSSNKRKKSATVSLQLESQPFIDKIILANKSYPAIGIKLRL